MRSVVTAFCELVPLGPPPREVSFDHLALGAGEGEPAPGGGDLVELTAMGGVGAQVGVDRGGEVCAAAADEALGDRQCGGGRTRAAGRGAGGQGCPGATCSGEGIAGGGHEGGGGGSPAFRLSRVADGGCEITAADPLVARALRRARETAGSGPRHLLQCYTARRMVDAGGAPIDRYVVLEHLSEGGMGAIYVGKKLGAGGFEMEVVLKQLLPEFTQQEEFIDLFLREAKLSATLDHANIVHTIDLVTAGGEYFIVMEYLPGGDLRTLLKKREAARQAVLAGGGDLHLRARCCRALAYAHVKRDFDGKPLKLIHRDVSPSNILRLVHGRGEADRLRHREGGDAQLAVLQGEGKDRLHVARAGEERAARSPQRSLLARRVHVRDADRRAAVRARRPDDLAPTRSTRSRCR